MRIYIKDMRRWRRTVATYGVVAWLALCVRVAFTGELSIAIDQWLMYSSLTALLYFAATKRQVRR